MNFRYPGLILLLLSNHNANLVGIPAHVATPPVWLPRWKMPMLKQKLKSKRPVPEKFAMSKMITKWYAEVEITYTLVNMKRLRRLDSRLTVYILPSKLMYLRIMKELYLRHLPFDGFVGLFSKCGNPIVTQHSG